VAEQQQARDRGLGPAQLDSCLALGCLDGQPPWRSNEITCWMPVGRLV
jgi:hypothetical protein